MAITPVAARGPASVGALPACAGRPRFGDALRNASRAAAVEPPAPSPLRALQHVERAQRRLDDILAQARSGRTFTGAELLALQAEAHRFSQVVDLASKVVEQGAQTVKQAVNTPL